MNINPKTTSPQDPKAPATAAGQYLGYSLQQTLLATRLRQAAAGSACSLEVLDDVAEQAADGTIHLTQSKNALTDNPVADRAVSLWKTLFNWLELVKLKLVDPETTTFEIYVSRQVGGGLVELFHNASDDTTAAQALKSARDLLWGAAPKRSLKPTISKALQKYANPVLEADEFLVIPIIRNFRLTWGEAVGSGLDNLILPRTIKQSSPDPTALLQTEVEPLQKECHELLAIFTTITKKCKGAGKKYEV